MGHPARVAIVQFLRNRRDAATCREIVARLPLAQSTVSGHLRVLERAGLVVAEPLPPRVRYRVAPLVLEEWKREVGAV
jgi:DNA-binding transcriptional ArsR family regulator